MRDYATESIRNVCLLGHGGSGKTTLAEAMLFNTGVLDRFGRVADGTTTTDYDPEEIKRKISISTALAPCEWKDCKINVLDTPGYFDFVGEVMQGIRVADSAVILVSAKSGVSVGTEKAWAYTRERNIPAMFFINKMDEENANFYNTLDQLRSTFGKGVIAFQIPVMQGEKCIGYVDLIHMKAKKFDRDKLIDMDIPADLQNKIDEVREFFNEAIAENDEQLMEKYFSGEPYTEQDILKGIKLGICNASVVPVFCGSAFQNQGVQALMDGINEYFDCPANQILLQAKKPGSEEKTEIRTGSGEPLAAIVFKTIADPFVGRISFIRVFAGTLKSDSIVHNATQGKNEKITQLFQMRGKKQINVDKLVTGDIGCVAKLQNTFTSDTLCDAARPVVLESIQFPEPAMFLAVEPKAKGDEEKISAGLHKLQDEDPTFRVSTNTETHQMLIGGVGEQHLDVIISKLKAKFGVSVSLTDPRIPYRETIKKKVKVEGKHKKQSGGHGQYGHIWIEFEPGENEGLTFEEKVFGGAVPRQYFPAVEKGLQESIVKGVLAGYPVVNLKATLLDGSYHPVDSSEMAFKIAAHLAYKKGLVQATPVLLEPIAHVEVYIPDHYMGDVIGDLNKKRGRILGMNPQEGGIQQVVAEVPQSEMFKYATELRSMTQGRGYFKLWFERYEEAPPMVSQKIIEEAKKTMTEDEDEE